MNKLRSPAAWCNNRPLRLRVTRWRVLRWFPFAKRTNSEEQTSALSAENDRAVFATIRRQRISVHSIQRGCFWIWNCRNLLNLIKFVKIFLKEPYSMRSVYYDSFNEWNLFLLGIVQKYNFSGRCYWTKFVKILSLLRITFDQLLLEF